jgi:hypothetical protein
VITFLSGILADLINFNRRLLEKLLYKVEKLEDRMGSGQTNPQRTGDPHGTDAG